jgi:hypothetical protein
MPARFSNAKCASHPNVLAGEWKDVIVSIPEPTHVKPLVVGVVVLLLVIAVVIVRLMTRRKFDPKRE